MNRRNQRDQENAVIRDIARFSSFLGGASFVRPRKDPPDFLAKEGGEVIGLELTSWLDSTQTRAAQGRARMSDDLLSILDWQRHPRPASISSAVIFPKWGTRVRQAHRQPLKDDFYAAVQSFDQALESLREKHWRPLSPDERFSYEAHQAELKAYPTLCRYVSSICFFERTRSVVQPIEHPWICISPSDGNYGLYDPAWSAQALTKTIESKIRRYANQNLRVHLESQNLHKFFLLVYTPELFASNTPYQNTAQMAVSPVEGLAEVSKTATANLKSLTEIFDGIFLFYSAWNSRWLAQIWPTFAPFLEAHRR
ncbi:MAG: hypothetical protein WA405_03930 [Candidatus Acidiferrales bacterium]